MLSSPIKLAAPYQARSVRFLQLAELSGWHVKVYGISALQEQPDPAFVEAAELYKRLQSTVTNGGTV